MRGASTCVSRVHEVNASIFSLLAAHGITLIPLSPLGAAVRGLDLRKTPPEPVLDALQSAMAVRGFLVFKDQGTLSGDEQVIASELWGAREMHSTHGVHPKAPNKHIFRLSNDRNVGILGVGPQWHNDGSFERGVFSHVGYHIIRVAEGGGGTIFAHQGGAFDALPEVEQERWQRLVSINSNSGVLHPVVHAHPISGRKSVYLHLGMTGAVLEVVPKSDDPSAVGSLRLLDEGEMRHLFQTYNALLNKGFAPGQADLLAGVPTYGTRVELAGLAAKPELNGRRGVVDGVLDRDNGQGDCIFIDNLAVAHRATPEAHRPASEVGLRILHRTTIKAPSNFDPPFGLPPVLNIHGANPLGNAAGGVWQGGGLGFRWDETIPMQN
ncbi:hypothetical protein EMIHUDRAFT_216634 [Emiliania huxleyi CCMP1516]|uniref:TauD/TfdA-like domain-containing protein n=2 Tax=Emiliania huxleyi TaxID=2903 RepID=A0A0D3IDC4_EMIH1|nr:hypothetical protein EMIHUDRAFT_216634 [Emiliania huxleyi CCMP1516]EOD09259.1 hypothetical protein EMIHUDRAFT_216634 [Emiliania huxleyi CCMP1516]|eukprot:XP_005761688.1 hypothetical protein EMIHUDRAFT_216634 [Emiliania huxleyi CCMP1516]